MLCYSSLHPHWDYHTPAMESRLLQISEELDTISLNHYRRTGTRFDELERQGIFLGNGGFLVALLQPDPLAPLCEDSYNWPRLVVEAANAALHATLWYCYTVGGRLYLLVSCPRLTEQDPAASEVLQALRKDFSDMAVLLRPAAPALRILVSDFQFGAAGIFRCFNALHHALDYYDFRMHQETVIHLDSERALHGAYAEDLSLYRQLSVKMAELLGHDAPENIANAICDHIIAASAPTIESIHHHVQLFMLTFTDYLGSSGLVDTSYMQTHRISYRAFEFETEAEFRQNMCTLIQELQRQHRVLQAVGQQQRVRQIREYIEEHITDSSLTVNQLSERFGVSTTLINKQFRYYYGISPYQFIQKTRLQKAQSLIRQHPGWSMGKISEQAGYSDLSTMYRTFRRHGAGTPGALKETVRTAEGRFSAAEQNNESQTEIKV